ncbi:VCBS repeat-containing protein [uncultured Roseobacter sp.]|uniref:FG-GAP repeat domain-containing protein n=1 Tax=uncultured Roseobacter sp. TaxID=114847 RepID=UPI00261F2296|nr:VCBS repeat-containing protein [uncultured Roseobacter sp.]
MWAKARRLLSRCLHRVARRALLVLCVLPGSLAATEAIISARYEDPTTRYAHGVLGDAVEHAALVIGLSDGTFRRFVLPDDLVFEDTAPRVGDLDFDGAPEVIVVESSQMRGARLTIYDAQGRITATEFIGTRFRWLAPVGAADLDGDGHTEIAFVDRPHLAKTLRLFRYRDQKLEAIASLGGLTNHRIGETDIAGGIRTCNGLPEMLVASADWSQMISVTLESTLVARPIGADTSRAAFARALDCAP